MKRIFLAIALFLAPITAALADCGPTNPNCIVPTAPPGTNNNQAASTAYVLNALAAPVLPSGQIFIGNVSNVASPQTLSGDGTLSIAGVFTLLTVNANVGSFGSATQCPTFTVNAKGLLTAASATTCTPAVGSITGLGTGVATALGVNIGSAGAPVLFNGAGGTPTSLTLTNATGLPISTGVSGLGSNVSSALQNTLNASSGLVSFNGVLGTVQAGSILTNATGLPISTGLTGAGTGVLTALGVNIGSAGAPVLFNGALGSPSSAGTLPAHTLGGTVSGGGNQINNVVIGASTPLAANFTTSASSTSSLSPIFLGGSGTTSTVTIYPTSGAGTTGSDIILANGSNGGTERARLLNNGNLGIGTNAPQSLLHVNANTTQNVAQVVPGVHVTSADGVSGGFQLDAFGAGNPQISMFASGGTAASKTATPSGGFLFILDAEGYNGSVYSGQGLWASVAAETWSGTSRGTYGVIDTTPIGSASRAEAIRIQASGGLSVGTTTDPGIGAILANTSIKATTTLTVAGMANAATTSAVCYNTGTGLFTYDGTIGTCTVSTLRAKDLKEKLNPKEGFDIVMAMEPWRYDLKKGLPTYKPGEQVGFVAEYAYEKEPRLVAMNPDGTAAGFLYEQYTAALTGAVQYLNARVQQLENR